MSKTYFVQINNQKLGPFTGEKLKELAAAGKLSREDFVSKDGNAHWVKASHVGGLFAHEPEPQQSPADSDGARNRLGGVELIHSLTTGTVLVPFACMLVLLVLVPILAPVSYPIRWMLLGAAAVFLALSLITTASFFVLRRQVDRRDARKIGMVALCSLVLAACSVAVAPGTAQGAHPVFNTPLSGKVGAHPAIHVDVLDATWYGNVYNSTFQLYLSVQTSRSSARVLLPINVKDFEGCASRYIQLPFEVSAEDNLVFDLQYVDGLSKAEQEVIVNASKAVGFCLQQGSKLYAYQEFPGLSLAGTFVGSMLMQKQFSEDVLGHAVEVELGQKLKHLAKADHIVGSDRPDTPHKANSTTLTQQHDGKKTLARANVRLYYPTSFIE